MVRPVGKMIDGIKVYDAAQLDALVSVSRVSEGSARESTGRSAAPCGSRGSTTSSSHSSKICKHLEAKKVLRNQAYWARMANEQAESERQVREKLEASRAAREQKIQGMYDSIVQGEEYMKQVDQMLELHDTVERRKAMARYNEWEEKVYGKIQAQVKAASTREAAKLRRLRHREYANFLRETNEKDSLFLDIVIASSYDPFTVNRNSLKCATGPLDDPTSRVLVKYQEERQMLPGRPARALAHEQGPQQAAAAERGTLPVPMWGAGRLESTPHGYFAKLMKTREPCEQASSSSCSSKGRRNRTAVAMDHFDFPRGKEAIDKEFPRGKRTDFSYLGAACKGASSDIFKPLSASASSPPERES